MTQSAELADYTIVAKNTAAEHLGSIHDNAPAQKFGYAGGLVPGVTLYGYMSHVLAVAWGPEWIRHGTMHSKSLRPAYEGQHVTVSCTGIANTDGVVTANLAVTPTDSVSPCAIGVGTFSSAQAVPPALADFEVLPMPEEPPAAGIGDIPVGYRMGTSEVQLTDDDLDKYLIKLSEGFPFYRERGAFPPSYLQQLTTHIERANFVYETPTIYVESWAQHFRELRVGDVVRCPGHVTAIHERKGNHYMDVEQLVLAGDNVVARVTRSSIYYARSSKD